MKKRVLVVVDIQNEYITEGRAFNIRNIKSSLSKAGKLLEFARRSGWPIVHVQHLQEFGLFQEGTELGSFIEGFEPQSEEVLAQKSNFSCFCSQAFVNFAETHKDKTFVVIGYGSTMCCLATIVDGYHRGYQFEFVRDASASKACGQLTEESMHEHAAAVLSTFATVLDTRELIS
jgi:nicotinamidase-related amidase